MRHTLNGLILILACILTLGSGCARSTAPTEAAGAPPMLQRSPAGGGAQKASLAADSSLSEEASAERMDDNAEGQSNGSSSSSNQAGSGASTMLKPQIIKTANLAIQVDRIDASMKALEKLTNQYQGIITNQSLSLAAEGTGHRSGSLEVRIPETQLSVFLEKLGTVGKVTEQNVTGRDVGAEIVDTEARVRNLKAQEEALQAIMRRAGKISEILEVSRELGTVRGQIEENQSRVTYLRQQVAYSTVTIALREKNVSATTQEAPSLFSELGSTAQAAFNTLYGTLVGLLQFIIWLVIYILPICAVILGGIWLVCKLLWVLILRKLFQLLGCCKPKQSTPASTENTTP